MPDTDPARVQHLAPALYALLLTETDSTTRHDNVTRTPRELFGLLVLAGRVANGLYTETLNPKGH